MATLRPEFEHSGLLDEVGGPAYLAQLLSAMIGIINAGEYGRMVHDSWLRRQLVDVGEEVVNRAFGAEPELDAKAQLEAAEQRLFDLAKDGGSEGGFVTSSGPSPMRCWRPSGPSPPPAASPACPPGLRDLDANTGGLHGSDLLILAGRPGIGKTALATKIAFGAAQALVREAQEKGPDASRAARWRSSRWK